MTLTGLTPGATYYWQVRAVNSSGITYADGAATSFWSFTIAAPPTAFTKLAPVNGTTNQPTSLTLYWNASSGFTSYEYCIDTTDDNACTNWVSNTTKRSVTLTGLNTGTTYYWQVRAKNASGITYADGSETAHWSFTITP